MHIVLYHHSLTLLYYMASQDFFVVIAQSQVCLLWISQRSFCICQIITYANIEVAYVNRNLERRRYYQGEVASAYHKKISSWDCHFHALLSFGKRTWKWLLRYPPSLLCACNKSSWFGVLDRHDIPWGWVHGFFFFLKGENDTSLARTALFFKIVS